MHVSVQLLHGKKASAAMENFGGIKDLSGTIVPSMVTETCIA